MGVGHLKRVPELGRDGKHVRSVDTWMVAGEDG